MAAGLVGLVPYVLRFNEPFKREALIMQRGHAHDFEKLVLGYLNELANQSHKSRPDSKSYVVQTLKVHGRIEHRKNDGVIQGIMNVGHSGRVSSIVDTEADDVEVYRRRTRDADLTPLYFRFKIPDGGDSRALLILQQLGGIGMKSIFDRSMGIYFGQKKYTLHMNPLTDLDLLDWYFQNYAMSGVRLITHVKPKEQRDVLAKSRVDGEPLPEGTKAELQLTRSKGLKERIGDLITHRTQPTEFKRLVEVPGFEDPDDVAIDLNVNGRKRTFRLIRGQNVPIVRDVTKEVKIAPSTGLPSYNSLVDAAADYEAVLWKQLVASITA